MLIELVLRTQIFMNSNFCGLEFFFLFEKEFLYIIIFKQMVDCNFFSIFFYLCMVKIHYLKR